MRRILLTLALLLVVSLPAAAQQLKDRAFDRQALSSRRLPYERLDQLVVDLLLGAGE